MSWSTTLSALEARASALAGRFLDDRRSARGLVIIALLGGLAIRLGWARSAPFGVDLGTSYGAAFDIATGVRFPITGAVASWGGTVPFPGYFYVIAFPLLFSHSPQLFVHWGALLCALGLIPFSLMLWERYGPRAAVFGSFLAAAAPWLVVGGDSPWSPKLAVPIVALLLYALHRVCAHDRSRWAAAVPLSLALQAHVYPNVPATLAAAVAVGIVCRPRVNVRWLVAGIAIAALTCLPSLVHIATHGTGQVGKWLPPLGWGRTATETLDATYHSLAFGSGDIAYEMAHGSWHDWGLRAYFRGMPGTLVDAYGARRSVFVVACVLVTLACWISAFVRAVQARSGWRGRDPMAVAFCAAAIASILLVVVARRQYLPRYGLVIVWLMLLPPIWEVARRRRASLALLACLFVAVPGYLDVARHYYRVAVPPNGSLTMHAMVETIVAEETRRPGARRFELDVPRPGVLRGLDILARRLYGPEWRRTGSARTVYELHPPRLDAAARRLVRRGTATAFPLFRGVLLLRQVPPAPAPRRPPPPPRSPSS